MKKITLLTIILLLSVSSILTQSVPPPVLQTGEKWTNLYSNSYDFQSAGSIRFLAQRPPFRSSFFTVFTGVQDSTDFTNFNTRTVWLAYTNNGGISWDTAKLISSGAPVKMNEPSVSLSGGIPIVSFDGNIPSTSFVYKDALWGLKAFSNMNLPSVTPAYTFPSISSDSIGKVVVAAIQNGQPFGRIRQDGVSWGSWQSVSGATQNSRQYDVASAYYGLKFAITGADIDANAQNSSVWYVESTDGGATFGPKNIIYTHILDGADTLVHKPETGLQSIYQGDNLHIVFGVYSSNLVNLGPNKKWFKKSQILHWSSITGLTTAANRNLQIQVSDTITQSGLSPFSQCTIGAQNPNYLYCAYTCFRWFDKQIVDNGDTVSTGDIVVSSSTNNGLTWSYGMNITHTTGIDEKSPSLVSVPSTYMSGYDSVGIVFERDMKAGYFTTNPEWGRGPVYWIFRKSLGLGVEFGINQNQIPVNFSLKQNYPNPFNPATTIEYKLISAADVKITLYDILGNEVEVLLNKKMSAGSHKFVYDASGLSSGVYFYKFSAGSQSEIRKMILIK